MRASLLFFGLAACGGAAGDGPPVVDGPTTDAPTGCQVGITYMPQSPIAAPDTIIRAVGHVSGSTFGAPEFTWFLKIGDNGPNMTPPRALPDNSEVEFPATQDALYHLRFRITDPNCDEAQQDIDVNGPGVGQIGMRVHVVAPDSANRAPVDKAVIVHGGANDLLDADVQLDASSPVTGSVTFNGNGVAAYLRLAPAGDANAAAEAFSNSSGTWSAKLASVTHTVLVVPATQTIPPQIVTLAGSADFALSGGVGLSGTVKDSANAAIAGASVQLVIGGLPSTVATTDGAGAFTVMAMPPTAGANVHVEVTPPAATGLPRLVTDSTMLNLANPIAVKYAAITTRNLAGTVVQRGAPLAAANVSIVGTLASAGTVTAGVAVAAGGEIRQTAVTNGSGVLPTLRAPATTLSAVIFPATAGDHAVTAIDLTTVVPGTITAAATVAKTSRISNAPNTVGLPGAVVDAVPLGPLALAGAPTIRKTANGAGQITIDLAPGGDYQFRFWDPNGNRGGLSIPLGTTPAAVTAQVPLADPTLVHGTVVGGSAIPGAIVQFLCSQCSGLEHDRPIAEGLTGVDGKFVLAVPNPN